MQGCSLSIQKGLLNKYAEEMVNYCTTASNNSYNMHWLSVDLLYGKE
jgi:hypothetical protein